MAKNQIRKASPRLPIAAELQASCVSDIRFLLQKDDVVGGLTEDIWTAGFERRHLISLDLESMAWVDSG